MQDIIVITNQDHRQYWLPFTKGGLKTLEARYKDDDQSIVGISIEAVRPKTINEKKWVLVRYETEELFFYPFSDTTLTTIFEDQDIIDDFYIIEMDMDCPDGMDEKAVYVEYQGIHTLYPYSAETIEKIVGEFAFISGLRIIDRGDVTKQLKLFGGA